MAELIDTRNDPGDRNTRSLAVFLDQGSGYPNIMLLVGNGDSYATDHIELNHRDALRLGRKLIRVAAAHYVSLACAEDDLTEGDRQVMSTELTADL